VAPGHKHCSQWWDATARWPQAQALLPVVGCISQVAPGTSTAPSAGKQETGLFPPGLSPLVPEGRGPWSPASLALEQKHNPGQGGCREALAHLCAVVTPSMAASSPVRRGDAVHGRAEEAGDLIRPGKGSQHARSGTRGRLGASTGALAVPASILQRHPSRHGRQGWVPHGAAARWSSRQAPG